MNSRRPGHRLGRAAGLFVLAVLPVVSCTSAGASDLSQTFGSPQDAARGVLDALASRDAERLLALALDEREFREVVWPELPSSRPEMGLPVEYAWGQLNQNSRAQLAMILAEHGGRAYRLIDVRFRKKPTAYGTFIVHRNSELIVRDSSGTNGTVRVFGSLLQRGDRWKIFSYVAD